MFKMITDTAKAPFEPLWVTLGLQDFAWVTDPWLARIAVIIGDAGSGRRSCSSSCWRARGADLGDRGGRPRGRRLGGRSSATSPGRRSPVSTTVILIRLIEGFKIVDLPNILTGGGPGTATSR